MNDETSVIQDSDTSAEPSPKPDAGGEAAPKKKKRSAGLRELVSTLTWRSIR